MSRKITKARVLELLREGWELGTSNGPSPDVWMQKSLCRGGESQRVNWNSFLSLRDGGQVVELSRREGDAYWLTRYGLPTAAADQAPTEGR